MEIELIFYHKFRIEYKKRECVREKRENLIKHKIKCSHSFPVELSCKLMYNRISKIWYLSRFQKTQFPLNQVNRFYFVADNLIEKVFFLFSEGLLFFYSHPCYIFQVASLILIKSKQKGVLFDLIIYSLDRAPFGLIKGS